MVLTLPVLTAYDPVTSAEGALDPLGLYSIADALGVRMIPGVRERQSRPRFLTAMAVGAQICAAFDEDRVAADGISPPWQVYEWLAVEGFVQSAERDDYVGLPGSQKTQACLSSGSHLSAQRYLKSPKVFGFHGVYRQLARTLDILDDRDRLGAAGYELLHVWEKEQRLEGFVGTDEGPGVEWRRTLVQVVRESLEAGAVARRSGWGGWRFFGEHLLHTRIPPDEARLLWQLMTSADAPTRAEVLASVVSPDGPAASGGSERAFHGAMRKRASADLAALLRAIDAYETFSRLMMDAWESGLCSMTRKAGRTTLGEIAAAAPVRKAADRVPGMWSELSDRLLAFELAVQFDEAFAWTSRQAAPEEWVAGLLEHHLDVQRRKPPNGKNPWFETLPDGSVLVRAAYRRPAAPEPTEEYVHAYRTRSLLSFARDLGMLRT